MDWRQVAEETGAVLGRPPEVAAPSGDVSNALPPPLRALYAECDGAELAMGSIYPQKAALDGSGADPFFPDWTVFGEDRYGTFWLCAREPDGGLWFTTWDHDAGVDIEGPVWRDLGDLLHAVFTDMLGMGRRGAALVIEHVPPAARMDVVRELGTLVPSGAAERLRMLDALPLSVSAEDARAAYSALLRLRTAGVRCHLQL